MRWPKIHWVEVLAWVAVAWIGMCVAERGESAEPTTRPAAMLTKDQLRDLYAMAYGRAGIGVPDKSPVIELVSIEQLQWIACEGRPCAIGAFQRAERVYLLETLDMGNPLHRAVLLHELVHYVQWVARGEAKTCEEYHAREVQAYEIQAFELDRADVYFSMPYLQACW